MLRLSKHDIVALREPQGDKGAGGIYINSSEVPKPREMHISAVNTDEDGKNINNTDYVWK
ncbi:hypothetical protein HZB94_00365 [Candidatus Falkowbacteria bacterium]|nr:hypothetical protein [Candidatus Falkowbacteria bacterium]